MTSYSAWFKKATGGFLPHRWQEALAQRERCDNQLIRVPTGMGKTAGTVLAWLYHRVVRNDLTWPRRLVFTLPMRVLVEQVERTLRHWLERAGLADSQVALHILMGGVRAEPWVLYPEQPAILLGTQDMIVSRALNRGFGAARGRWPQDFGLLHTDALWVLDEVQLMDVSLMTSVQLAVFRAVFRTVFRNDDAAERTPWPRPARCWWMSATLRSEWLMSADSGPLVADVAKRMVTIPEEDRQGEFWEVPKVPERRADVAEAEELAALAAEEHQAGTLSLVIVNRVDWAVAVFDALEALYSVGKGKKRTRRDDAPELRLIHSRFRGAERAMWAEEFLCPDAGASDKKVPAHGRIIVSTQVIEAGVDISARLLITQLAPWASLVQRMGRAGRRAKEPGARVIVCGPVPDKDSDALPYDKAALRAAASAWQRLIDRGGDASLAALARFEDALADEDACMLYPYEPEQVLQRSDIDDLFDTTPDLTGADLDVSGFIRSGQARDISVVWRAGIDTSSTSLTRDKVGAVKRYELCPVPRDKARSWLAKRPGAFVWDYLSRRWNRLDSDRLRRLLPGSIVLVAAERGGYDSVRGWDEKIKDTVADVSSADVGDASRRAPDITTDIEERFADTASAQEDDSLSQTPTDARAAYKTIATHGRETAEQVVALCDEVGLTGPYQWLLELAGRWHDAGKVHEVFQAAIIEEARAERPGLSERRDLAKAPASAWRKPRPYPNRPGFRHELVSTLALFELLRRTAPNHPALLGGCRAMLDATGIDALPVEDDEVVATDHPLAAEIATLDQDAFDLLAYLVCSHHGKVRCAWTGTPLDQEPAHGESRGDGDGLDSARVHGVKDRDRLDGLRLCDQGANVHEVPGLTLSLDCAALGLNGRYGASWTERVSRLRARLGPFVLAYFEALLRAADARASRLEDEDHLL